MWIGQANGVKPRRIFPPAGIHLCRARVPRAEIAASHQTDGTAAHFTCKNCGLLFDAEKRETTPEALVLPKFDHTFGEALESDAEAHWYACGEKSAVFTRTFA